jgi:regulatory protein
MTQKITGLRVQERNPKRVNVYLDGEFAFGLQRITAAWLYLGQELDDNKIAELKAADKKEVALQKALHFVDYRPRSVSEVRRRLEENHYPEGLIQEILDRFQELGLLNDQRFAESWVENRKEFRPRSKSALRMELRLKGIPDETIDQAVETVDDEEQAFQAGMKQARKYRNLEWQDFRKKMFDFLMRRGFNYEIIAPVIHRIWEERNSGEATEEL